MTNNEGQELYRRYRPTSFKQLIGQDDVVKSLVDLGKRNAIPHCILLTGPSGCGKTTTARILRKKLKCGDADYCEVNAAESRGIDMVRGIQQRMMLAPIAGDCRVWCIDESHKISSDGMSAMLKMLEDTPSHVYFLLATTNPEKLLPTIKTRATEIKLKLLSPEGIEHLIKRTAKSEGVQLSEDVVISIQTHAEGSARKALVLLHAVIGIENED